MVSGWTIWKYPLEAVAGVPQLYAMPELARILHVSMQHDKPIIWALGNTKRELFTREFVVLGTGHEVPDDNLKYLGTGVALAGLLVWHVFERLVEE